MLLCHYSFVNPSIVDSGMCSRAAITLCVQLGLHQEPTPENIRSHIDLESQRRIFWTCYVLDAQNNMMSGKPSSLVHVHISVRFPTVEKEDSKCGEKTAIANCWYAFRQIETEITLGLLHHDNCRDSKITAPEWLDDARTRIDYWRDNLDSHKWAPRIEFRYIAYHFQKMRLNRMSPRIPHPTNFMRRECIAAGAFIAFEIHRYSNHGNFFYWHHCCCHFFEIGIVLVESTHTGLDLILQQDESFLDLTNMDTIMRVMQSIPLVLKKMTHRWPQVKLMAFELEALFKPALQRLKDSVRGRVISQSSEDGLVAYQLSLIKRYLFCGRGTNLGYQREESLVPYPQFGQQIIAAQNLLSLNNSITGDHIDVEKVHDMLQPINTGFENLWSPATNVEHTSIIQPVDEADNAPILHDATSPSIVSTVNENNPFSILDLDPNWLTHTENPLSWHGNGLELDDIFTAFNEGNIY